MTDMTAMYVLLAILIVVVIVVCSKRHMRFWTSVGLMTSTLIIEGLLLYKVFSSLGISPGLNGLLTLLILAKSGAIYILAFKLYIVNLIMIDFNEAIDFIGNGMDTLLDKMKEFEQSTIRVLR